MWSDFDFLCVNIVAEREPIASRNTCTAMETSSVASLSAEAFRAGVAVAQVEPFETARLLQLLFRAPNKRSAQNNEEIAVRLSSLTCFSSKDVPASCEKLSSFVEACPCPKCASFGLSHWTLAPFYLHNRRDIGQAKPNYRKHPAYIYASKLTHCNA
jgi:hypothetical protein